MHRALYRKWRPQVFDDVCGQNQITDILKYEVANEKTSHAYLFCGSRGTGKTTCAKILAKAVNCLSPVDGNPCNVCEACRSIDSGTATDVVEMDAASNTGVDNVRDIKEEIVFSPADLKYRVYIIDEVHMLSASAFNALLKTLEEPPAHVLFILATTELQKLPATVISRCQRFDFRRIASDVIVARLSQIAKAEGVALTEDGARLIARIAEGGMRDAISLFELCAGLERTVDVSLVSETLGVESRDNTARLVRAVAEKNYSEIYGVIEKVVMSSRDLSVFIQETIDYYRDLMVVKTSPMAKEYLDLTDVELKSLTEDAEHFSLSSMVYCTKCLEDALYAMQRAGFPKRTTAEIAFTRMCEPRLSSSPESLVVRIEKLEQEVSALRIGGYARMENASSVGEEKTAKRSPIASAVPASEKKTQDAPATGAPKDLQGDDVYRPFPGFSDVVESIGRTRPQIVRFLETAKAYMKKDGSTLIRVRMGLGASILSREDNLSLIRAAAVAVAGAKLENAPILVESVDAPKSNAVIDELVAALSDSEEI